VYIGAFDDIRDVFAASPAARERGLSAGAFSFNSAQGQCERCRGAGFEKIEMQFLSDVFVRCPVCQGRRYREHILEVKVERPDAPGDAAQPGSLRSASIADLLEAPVDQAWQFLAALPSSRPARRAAARLQLLRDVGLGYLRIGQPVNTLSGGESQRLKLVSHLAESTAASDTSAASSSRSASAPRRTLFLFDEPTTGLHFEDIRILLLVFQRMVDQGHSVVVVEHNLDVIRQADWVVDLGPDAGTEGGRIVVTGTPETVAAHPTSHTGTHLRTEHHLGS
jgi:excinuclease ABC subunit A